MKAKHATSIRHGILSARALAFPERLTDSHRVFLVAAALHLPIDRLTRKARDREYRKEFAALEAMVRHPNCRCFPAGRLFA